MPRFDLLASVLLNENFIKRELYYSFFTISYINKQSNIYRFFRSYMLSLSHWWTDDGWSWIVINWNPCDKMYSWKITCSVNFLKWLQLPFRVGEACKLRIQRFFFFFPVLCFTLLNFTLMTKGLWDDAWVQNICLLQCVLNEQITGPRQNKKSAVDENFVFDT